MRKHQKDTLYILLLLALMLGAGACSNNEDDKTASPFTAEWKTSSTVSSNTGVLAILLQGTEGASWSADVVEGESWCAFSQKDMSLTQKNGTLAVGINVVYVYYKTNTGTAEREAKISVHFNGQSEQTLSIIQMAKDQENAPAFACWAEMPMETPNANYQYVTHYTKIGSQRVRNFSICYDATKCASHWVAYPIHISYLRGSGGRTNAWAFDPIIPESHQPNLVTRSYRGHYDRGHQMPSADRLANNEMNAQTFYMTNMTPQLSRLNQDMWAKLESQVRTYNCDDTLFVVTGAHFGNSNDYTTDGIGRRVPIPTHYYKVLLRTKKGNTGKAISECSDSELKSIGFWVEHESYGDIRPPKQLCTSVADIERKTGFTFFPQVSAAVKNQNNPHEWGY